MLRSAVSLICALAMLSPAAAFASERHDRRDFNRVRPVERRQITNFGNRSRVFDQRDRREWERRREGEWRDRRYDRRSYRPDYRRDRYDDRRIIIIPHFSF